MTSEFPDFRAIRLLINSAQHHFEQSNMIVAIVHNAPMVSSADEGASSMEESRTREFARRGRLAGPAESGCVHTSAN